MTPERTAELVARWVRLYTRRVPAPVAERRIDEIAADLHDQIAYERAEGASDHRIALGLLSRMVRGLPADASWRHGHAPVDRSLIAIVVVTAVLLAVPLVAMQFSEDVVWSIFDFAFAGALIGGAGLLVRAAVRKTRDPRYRAAAAVAFAATFMLIWGNLAVGMVGEPEESANGWYVAVLAVGILGAVAARFRPDGMARALLAMAAVQALVAAIVLVAGEHEGTGTSAFEVVALNGFFAALFVGAALLFRRAAVERAPLEARSQE